MSMFSEFLKNDHRRAGKWVHYFPIYETYLSRFQNRYVTLLEIGVDSGGSLQLWKRFLGPSARIVGIDINPECADKIEDQISVRIGSQADRSFLLDVVREFGPPDIVVDDGSHQQEHIHATFDVLFPLVPKNGVYIIEDLHTSYWDGFGGGLGRPGTFIERAKHFIDAINATHTGGGLAPSDYTDRIAGLHFYDSMVVVEIGEQRAKYDRWIGTE